MTLDEARDCQELALWSDSREEFLLSPDTGVVWWRPLGEMGIVHGDSWHPVPAGKTIPLDGWSHRLDCGCPHCR